MNSSLLNLIQDVSDREADIESYTHYTYFSPAHKWTFNLNEYSHFWLNYCTLARQSEQGILTGKLSLGERADTQMPVSVQFSFKFPNNGELESFTEYYNDAFIITLVKCYQRAIEENFELSSNLGELMCFVLEQTSEYIKDNKNIINIRLHFPYTCVETKYHVRIIRPRVINLLRQTNPYGLIFSQPLNDWDDIIDLSYITDALPLYQSVKNISEPIQTVTKILPRLEYEDTYDIIPEYEFNDVFRADHLDHVKRNLVEPQIFNHIEDEEDMDFWMPMMLSKSYYTSVTRVKHDVVSSLDFRSISDLRRSNNSPNHMRQENVVERDIDIAKVLLNMLKSDKAKHEHYWLDVGRALYNCDPTVEGNGFNTWIAFSKNGGKDEEVCELMWGTFEMENPITYKTIAFYAKQDNPSMYKKWHDERCRKYFEKVFEEPTATDHDVSLALYWVYWLEFICADAGKKSWYVYKMDGLRRSHRWVPCDDGIELKSKISGEFRNRIEKLRTYYSTQGQRELNENAKDKYTRYIERANKLIVRLKSNKFKNQIMRDAKEKFKDDNFLKYRDQNHNYMGLLDCVIECVSDRAVARNGKPEDYITMCSRVRYHHEYNWDHPKVKEVMLWMRQMFPDPDLLDYILKFIASLFRSGNSEKIFPCFTGEGDNSKSMFKRLLELVFGAYCITFSTDVLTGRGGNRTNTQKALAKYSKLVFAQEPDENDSFQNGIIKELTGMDVIYGSLLYENGGNFEVFFVLILIANKIPIIPGADKAIINRFRAFPFLSTWSSDAPDSIEQQFKTNTFKKDKNFSSKIPFMAPAMMWILVQFYAKYATEGLKEPKIVTQHTKQYWEEHDIYLHFKRECIETVIIPGSKSPENPNGVPNPNVKLSVSDVYTTFRLWMKDTYPDIKVPNNPAMRYELTQRWGKSINNEWAGIKIKQGLADVDMIGYHGA